jgi:hypothetical protein
LVIIVVQYAGVATTQQYLTLLQDLLKAGIPAAEMLALLKLQNSVNDTFGISVARYQNATTTQQYLTLLQDLLRTGIPATEMFALLMLQVQGNHSKETLGTQVAQCQNIATIQQYLTLLQNLLKAGIPAAEILTLLKLQNSMNDTFGIIVARRENTATTQQYLTLLQDLLRPGIPAAEMLVLLKLQDDNYSQETLGMKVARCRNTAAIQQYLTLLQDLLKAGIPAAEMLVLLKLQNYADATFGIIAAQCCDAAAIQQYLILLKELHKVGIDISSLSSELLLIELFLMGKKLVNPEEAIANIYQLLNLGLLSPKDYLQLAGHKEAVLRHIQSLPAELKIVALKRALDKTDSLGQLFWLKRGVRDPDPSHKDSTLYVISKQFEQASRGTVSAFYGGSTDLQMLLFSPSVSSQGSLTQTREAKSEDEFNATYFPHL